MKSVIPALLFSSFNLVGAFFVRNFATLPPATRLSHRSQSVLSASASGQLPTVDELSKAPFVKQLSYSEQIISLLKGEEVDNEDIQNRLNAQLSHSDGIRGFFVTYLTTTDDNAPADQSQVPPALVKAMEAADPEIVVPLVCMNVVMPTAMVSMHTDPTLSKQSQKTAERGKKVLSSLRSNDTVQKQCEVILAVASGEMQGADPKLVDYWTEFFDKWGYEDLQKRDIARAIQSVLDA